MTFEQAIKNMTMLKMTGRMQSKSLQTIYDAVQPLCKTPTSFNGRQTELHDWLWAGEYHDTDTPQGLADEWDATAECVED